MDSNYMGLVSELFYNGDDENGYAAFIHKAKQGDTDACLFLVIGYLFGEHKEEEGWYWLQKGIEAGSEECLVLRSLYDDSVCPCEPSTWFRLAFLFESLCMEHSKEMIPLFIRLMNRYPLGEQGEQAKEVCLALWKRTGDAVYIDYFLKFCSMAGKRVGDPNTAFELLNRLIEHGYEPARLLLLRNHLKGRWTILTWDELLRMAKELEEKGHDVRMEKAYILCAIGKYQEAYDLYWEISKEGDKRGNAALLYLYSRYYWRFNPYEVHPLMKKLGNGYADEMSRILVPVFEGGSDEDYRKALVPMFSFYLENWGNEFLNEAMLLSVFKDYPYMEGGEFVQELIKFGIQAGLPNAYALRYMYKRDDFPFNGGDPEDLFHAISEGDCPLAKILLVQDAERFPERVDKRSLLRDLILCPNISLKARVECAVHYLYRYGEGVESYPIMKQINEWAEELLKHVNYTILDAVYQYTEMYFCREYEATRAIYKLFQFERSDGSIELLMAVAFDRGLDDKNRYEQVEKLARCGAKKGHPLAKEFLITKLLNEGRTKAAAHWEHIHTKPFVLDDYREALRAVIGYNFPDGIK